MKSNTITNLFHHRHERLFLATFWILAAAGLVQSGLVRIHQGMTANWFSLSFYFIIPAILFSISLPAITKIHDLLIARFHLVQSLLVHVLASIVFAIMLRFLALWIDFHLQRFLGTMTGTFDYFMRDVQFLYFASVIGNMALYGFVVLMLYLLPVHEGEVIVDNGGTQAAAVVIKDRHKVIEVMPENIHFIEAFGNYLKIHLPETTVCVRGTISSIERRLPPSEFFRVHRSFIVNKTAVREFVWVKYGRCTIRTTRGKFLPTGKHFLHSVLRLQASCDNFVTNPGRSSQDGPP